MAIGALLIAVACLLLASYMMAELARDRIRRMQCGENLRWIGQATHIYANDHAGSFPPNLHTLIEQDIREASSFQCPTEANRALARIDYAYVAGLTDRDPSEWVLCYDLPDNHYGHGRYVLFVDGHGHWYDEPRFQEELERFRRAFREARGIDPEIVIDNGRQ